MKFKRENSTDTAIKLKIDKNEEGLIKASNNPNLNSNLETPLNNEESKSICTNDVGKSFKGNFIFMIILF